MGISGLLPLLGSIQTACSLKKYAGRTIGVDAYGWLHRGTAACVIELAQGKPTTKFVDFAMKRVQMLIHFGITPYIVFDGDFLPSKAGTEQERAGRRKEGKRLGLELLRAGKISQAHIELQKAVDVTPEMARMLIEELKRQNIQYIVAPFEADSQLAYLEQKGIISGIISEDSDLLVFGARCLITKLDQYGDCIEVNRSRFTACREISLVGWTDQDFRRLAILSGCDYLPRIGGLGLKTAYRMLRKHNKNVERLVKAAQFDGKFKIPQGYLEAFHQAEKTFLYQWVYCPLLHQIVNLTPLPDDLDVSTVPFIGQRVPSHLAVGIAQGELHPHTKQPLLVSWSTPRNKSMRSGHLGQVLSVTSAGKDTKPIDSFFKPKRTPLAELDVNLFTPSPSQQTLLEQQRESTGWEAVEVSQARLPQARTASQPMRRVVSNSATLPQTAPNPAKRQRLCSDSVLEEAGAPDFTHSRFFTAEPSPSLRKKGRNQKSTYGFELYSDDSVEKALADCADLEEAVTQPKKKLRVFSDCAPPIAKSGSQAKIVTHTTPESSEHFQTGPVLTPLTSQGSSASVTSFKAPLSKQLESLQSQFSFIPEGKPRNASRALALSNHETITSEERHTLTGLKAKGKRHTLIEDAAWAAMEAEVIIPASDADPASSRFSTPIKWNDVKGSEDLLIPDSDAESISSPIKPLLDLGRYAFNT